MVFLGFSKTVPENSENDLKGHSQLCDCADLDTSFSHFEKKVIKVHLEIRFIFRSVLLDFQSFTENLFLSVLLSVLFEYPMILFLSYLVKNSIYRISVICKLAVEWYVMGMCVVCVCGQCAYVCVQCGRNFCSSVKNL